MYNLTKALNDDGVPIDYVGAQTHIDLGWQVLGQYHTPVRGALENMPPKGETLCRQRAAGCRQRAAERSTICVWPRGRVHATFCPLLCGALYSESLRRFTA